MRTDCRFNSNIWKYTKQGRKCGHESLEQRIVLSAASDVQGVSSAVSAAVTAMPGGTPLSVAGSPAAYFNGAIVTGSQIITATDTIPRFLGNPTITNIKSGGWSDPSVWSLGRVPTDNDRVLILTNTSIQYAASSNAHINTIEIDGSLLFSTSANTRLIVGTMTVMPTGTLQIGTTATPVAPQVKAELVIADQALDLVNDPLQYGTGLIALGTVSIHGAGLSQTWDNLAAEPRAGDTSLLLMDQVSGWQPGETLVLPDTRQVLSSDDKRFPAGQVPPEWEQVVIDHIQGNQVFLTAPLQFDHLGAYDTTGNLRLLPHVALLDRNVVIRSENPQGTRGEIFFTARANIDIEYARFQDLGRTDAFQPLDNTTFDAQGNVTHIGTNQDGRFAVHFADLMGPVNSTNTGYQFQFVGNTVDGALRWAVDVQNASYGLLQGNVVYNAQGAGFVTEEGSEIGNVFRSNITIRIQGTHDDGKSGTQTDDYGRGGSGFWFRRGGNTITGNVAADSTYAGFVIDGYYAWDAVALPNFRGADTTNPSQTTMAKLSPASTWANNEAYGMTTFGLWAAYISGDDLAANQPTTVFFVLRIWNVWIAAVDEYHTSNVTFNRLLVLGDESAQNRNDQGTFGLALGGDYENHNLVVANSWIEGVRIGLIAPTNDSSDAGAPKPTIVRNTVFKNYINVVVAPPLDDRPGNGNALELRNDSFTLVSTLPPGPASLSTVGPPRNIAMTNASFGNLTQPSTVKVYNYNQVQGDNFQVFYNEQSPGFIMPQTNPALLSSTNDGTIGSPAAGLTNAQNWLKYGIAMAGGVAPAGASASRPEILGLVGPLQNPSAVAPRVVLITPWQGALVVGSPPLRVRYNVNGVLPAGAVVYLALDGGTPATQLSDGEVTNITAGRHVLVAYIADANGQQWPGTVSTSAIFFLHVAFGAAAAVATASPAAAPASPADPSGAAAISAALVSSSDINQQSSQTSTLGDGLVISPPASALPAAGAADTTAPAQKTSRPSSVDQSAAHFDALADDLSLASPSDELLTQLATDSLAKKSVGPAVGAAVA